MIAFMTPGTAPVIAIPEPPGDFDGLGWINQHFSYELVYEELKPVLYFLLLWNLFEDKLCERNACPSKMRASVDKGSFKLSRYDVYMKFFKMTYFPNVEMSEDAINYFFRAGAEADEKTEVRDAFGVAEMDLRTD